MTTQELIKLLEDFIHLPGENEIVEFKKAQNGFDTQKLGEYFSALSNEANLGQEEFAWLLFGIHDKTHTILGRCLTSRGNGFSLCLTIPLRETEYR